MIDKAGFRLQIPINGGLPVPNIVRKTRAAIGEVFYKTTAEATKAAKKIGYVKVKQRTRNGEAIFYNRKKKMYISRDTGSGNSGAHNGGVWKGAKSAETLSSKETRAGTFDANMRKIGE